jgi:hypothetical protein
LTSLTDFDIIASITERRAEYSPRPLSPEAAEQEGVTNDIGFSGIME